MRTDDAELARIVRRDLPAAPAAPGFSETWAAAERRYRRSRRRMMAVAAAAAAAVAAAVVISPGLEPEPEDSWIGDEFLTSTSWSAPSDVLLPSREFDIYQDLPSLNTSTKSDEGALL